MTVADQARRIVIGHDAAGRSAVVDDAVPGVRTERPNGAVVHELWRQESLPVVAPLAEVGGGVPGRMLPLPPNAGVSVRIFTLPPDGLADLAAVTESSLTDAFGAGNVGRSQDGRLLTRTSSLYVATVVSGQAYLVLEASEVLLAPGVSFVLPRALHAWRNPFVETAVIVATVFAISDDRAPWMHEEGAPRGRAPSP